MVEYRLRCLKCEHVWYSENKMEKCPNCGENQQIIASVKRSK